MNVFNKVTLQSLKRNKTRTIVTIIGILLSSAMICAVTTFASSLQNYAKDDAIYTYGNWHGRTLGTSYQTYETVRDSGDTAEAVYLQQLGYAYAEGCENEFKPYLYLLGGGNHAEQVLPIHITSGSYPTASDEILLPNHLYTNGGVRHRIGDTLTLALGDRILDGDVLTQQSPCYTYDDSYNEVFNGEVLAVRETRTYTVVGFYERMNWEIEDYSAPGYTAITVADDSPSGDYNYDVYFRMKSAGKIYAFMQEQELGNDTNSDLLRCEGTFRYSSFSRVLYSLAAIVIVLIMFGSVALIYNAFSISVSERTRQFGLLASVGATKKQLRRMVLFEALAVSLVGIPLGILAGVGGIGVTLLIIGSKFRSLGFMVDMRLSVSPMSIVIATLVALVTVLISAWVPSVRATKVSAVEAIRQNQDIAVKSSQVRTSKLTYRLFGLPGLLAQKHYKRNRKKYRTTILSLFMSIVLFVSASAFTDYLMETVSGGLGTAGYDLFFQARWDSFDEITPDELLNRIKSAKAVTGGAYLRQRYENAEIPAEYLTDEGIAFLQANQGQNDDASVLEQYTHFAFVDDTTYKALLKQYGLSEQKFLDAENPLAIAVDGVTRFNVNAEKYENIRFYSRNELEFAVKMYKEIPGYSACDTIVDESGNTIVRYLKDGADYDDGEFLELPEAEAVETIPMRVGQVVTQRPFFLQDMQNMDGTWIVYPFSLADAVFEGFASSPRSGSYYNFLINSSSHSESYTDVQTVLLDSGFEPQNLQDVAAAEESDRNLVTIVRVFSYGFIVLISLIAAANVFNTISTNISLRRREFAMLKSVGMSKKSFNQMMNYECLLYGTRALLYGLPVSCVVTYFIYRAILEGYGTTFHLPWAAIGIASLSVFLVVFATMMYAMGKIKKDNPIDALKNENL